MHSFLYSASQKTVLLFFFLFSISASGQNSLEKHNSTHISGTNPPTVQSLPESSAYLMGKAAGLSATDTEIQERKALLNKLNRSMEDSTDIPREILEQMIVADKFFKSQAITKATADELRDEYDSLLLHLPAHIQLSFEEAEPLLEMKVLASKVENISRMQQLVQSRYEQERENSLSANDPVDEDGSQTSPYSQDGSLRNQPVSNWSIAELQLSGYPDECAAFNEVSGSCIVTLEQFNNQVVTFTPSKELSLDDARKTVLDKLLNIMYLSEQARQTGFSELPEVQKKVSLRVNSASKLPNRTSRFKALSEKELRALYNQHYSELFAEHEEVFLSILGSTDSLLIDSMYRKLTSIDSKMDSLNKADTLKGSNPRAKRKQRTNYPVMPWGGFVDADSVPNELARTTDSLMEGQFTQPIHIPYGHFIVRVAKVNIIPEIPFNKAHDKLIALQLKGQGVINPKDLEKQAHNYYMHHKNKFVSPDTLLYSTWLVPGSRTSDNLFINDSTKMIDTNSIGRINITSTSMPREMGERLTRLVPEDSTAIGAFIGPVEISFGCLYAQLTKIKNGGKILKYETVKSQIKAKLKNFPTNLSDVPLDKRTTLIANEALAQGYWQKLMADAPEPTEKQIKEALAKGLVTLPEGSHELSPQQRNDLIKMSVRDLFWRKDLDTWKSEIKSELY